MTDINYLSRMVSICENCSDSKLLLDNAGMKGIRNRVVIRTKGVWVSG